MMSGSSALPRPVMHQWESITAHRLLERYGMTVFVKAMSNPLRGERKAGTVGKPLPGVEKYIPAMKEIVKAHVEPHIQTLFTKAKEAYHASKSAVTPHIIKFQEHVDPYYKEAKKFSKPYVDQVKMATKPHVDKVRATMKPYTKKAIQYYKASKICHNVSSSGQNQRHCLKYLKTADINSYLEDYVRFYATKEGSF